MFVALREIRAATGRFSLMGSVVGMIALLLVMLTGLTSGLANQNISSLRDMEPTRYIFGLAGETSPNADDPETLADTTFAESAVTEDDLQHWGNTEGVDTVVPVGAAQTLMSTGEGDALGSVGVLGVPADAGMVERTVDETLTGSTEPADGTVIISESVAEDHQLSVDDTVTIGPTDVQVAGVVEDQYYSHSEVVWVSTDTWQQVSHADEAVQGTVLAVYGDEDAVDWEATGADSSTVAKTVSESYQALPAYGSEQGSLTMMQGFLYVISALVIVSFVTVWTIQRTRDLAVLRALGGSTGYLLRDSLGQAAVILGVGVVVGAGLGAVLGALVAGTVPFTLTAVSVIGPAAGIWVLGMLGSALAVKRVARIDPQLALGGN